MIRACLPLSRNLGVIVRTCSSHCSHHKYVPLSHGATCEGCKVLQRSSLRGSGGNDGGVLHGVVLLKSLDELSDGGSLLTNGDVDAVKLLLLVSALIPAPCPTR